jgi:hypothetical protein
MPCRHLADIAKAMNTLYRATVTPANLTGRVVEVALGVILVVAASILLDSWPQH